MSAALLAAVGLACLGAWRFGPEDPPPPNVSWCRRCEARFRDEAGLYHHMTAAHPLPTAEECR